MDNEQATRFEDTPRGLQCAEWIRDMLDDVPHGDNAEVIGRKRDVFERTQVTMNGGA